MPQPTFKRSGAGSRGRLSASGADLEDRVKEPGIGHLGDIVTDMPNDLMKQSPQIFSYSSDVLFYFRKREKPWRHSRHSTTHGQGGGIPPL